MITKIKHIVKGWFNYLFGKEKRIMNKRMRICKPCEHNYFGVCNLCGCVLKAKTSEPDEHCDIEKW